VSLLCWPLALLLDAFDLGLDLGDRRRRRVGLELGDFRRGRRLDAKQFADFMLDIAKPTPGGIVALFAARGFGTRFADRFERKARRFVCLAKLSLGRRQPVGRGAAPGGGGFDVADQRLTLAGKFLRRVLQFGAFALCLCGALAESGDLRRGVAVTLVPLPAFGGDRGEPMIG
jgi:hypothetical protein